MKAKANPADFLASTTDPYRPTVKDQCQTVLTPDPLLTRPIPPTATPELLLYPPPAISYKDQQMQSGVAVIAPAGAAFAANETTSPDDGRSEEPILVTARVVDAPEEELQRSSTTATITKRKPIDP
jgi:hypothetical protein